MTSYQNKYLPVAIVSTISIANCSHFYRTPEALCEVLNNDDMKTDPRYVELDLLPVKLDKIPAEWEGHAVVLVVQKDSGRERRVSGYVTIDAAGSAVVTSPDSGKFRRVWPPQIVKAKLVE